MRKKYLDNLRLTVVVMVVIYHVIYFYNGTNGTSLMDAYLYFVYPWFMFIIFLISGMSSYYYLENHDIKEFIKARTKKLLVPSTIGVILFGYPQGYLNMYFANALDNIPAGIPFIIKYLIICLSGIGVMWTMQMLWLFSICLVLIKKRVNIKVNYLGFIILGIVAILCGQIGNITLIPMYRFGYYGFAYFLGFYVLSNEENIKCFENICFFIICIIFGVFYSMIFLGQNYAIDPLLSNPISLVYGYLMSLSLLGIFKKYFNKKEFVLVKDSFGIYLFHYLFICLISLFIKNYLLSFAVAMLGSVFLYKIIKRIPIIRTILLGE